MALTLDEVASELYGGPLQDFVSRRNARAKEVKADTPDLAARVAKLPKPVATAHLLNTFAREEPELLDALLDLGSDLREAQEHRDGDQVRALTKEAGSRIQAALRAMGSDDPGLEQTLRAAMADEGAAAALRAGVLVKPLEPAGFGPVDLAGAVAVEPGARASRRRSRKQPSARDAGRERAEAQAREAAQRLAAAEAELAECEGTLAAATREHEEAKERVAAVGTALQRARDDERAAGRREREARQKRDAAARAVAARQRV